MGCLASFGQIKNLTFKDAQVTSTLETIGIVAANSNGKVENCHTIGTSSVNGTYNVGGIVEANGRGTITNCTNAAQVASSDNDKWVGGIAGTNHGIVSTCINSGAVSGYSSVGGIVGMNDNSFSQAAVMVACGNTGTVSGSESVGGIVGNNQDATVIASWTINTAEKDGNSDVTDKDGVGTSSGTITSCYSAAAISDWSSVVGAMNGAISTWNTTFGNESKQVNYHWTVGTETNATPVLTSGAPTAASGSGSGN